MVTTDHDVKHLNNKYENKLTLTYEVTLQTWLIDVKLTAQQKCGPALTIKYQMD